ncbi:hypothetical protein LCGC14_1452100, partial [marine sediment metagenome]
DGSDKRIYCMIGDGEAREGQIWEALDYIVDQKLTNVIAIFNCNGQGQSDYVSVQQTHPTLASKLEAFGYEVKTIDGHNWDDVFAALTAEPGDKPLAIVAKTLKGWGVKELLSGNYHGKPVAEDNVAAAIADLDEKAVELGVGNLVDSEALDITTPAAVARPSDGPISAGSLADALTEVGL